MSNISKTTISLLIGLVTLGLSVFNFASGSKHEYYGGDAYTGIQQACADAANNTSRGFGSLFAICSVLSFLSFLYYYQNERKKTFSDAYYQFLNNIGETEMAKDYLLSGIKQTIDGRFEVLDMDGNVPYIHNIGIYRHLTEEEKYNKAVETYNEKMNHFTQTN